jgi:two-component system nitrate/nitrite response regulator NarL
VLDFDTAKFQRPCRTKRKESDETKLLILSNCDILRTGLAKALASWPFQTVDTEKVEDVGIARRLGSCEATVKVQMKAIIRKLGLQNRTQAAVWAVKNGFEATLLNAESVPRAGSLGYGELGRHALAPGPPHKEHKWLAHR